MAEQKKTLSAKEVVADIRAGATDEFLMEKYGINEKGLQSLFQKLISAKVLTQAELDRRSVEEVEAVIIEDEAKPVTLASTSTQTVFRCPACNMPQSKAFEVCPQCGIIVEKFLKKKTDDTVVEEPAKEPTKVVEQPEEDVIEPTLSKPAERPQEKLKKAGSQAVDKAKELRDKVTESSAWTRLLEFIKVPKNRAIVGAVGLVVVILAGVLFGYVIPNYKLKKFNENMALHKALIEAVKRNNVAEILTLLDQGASINAVIGFRGMKGNQYVDEQTAALHEAVMLDCKNNSDFLVDLLLKKGAKPDIKIKLVEGTEVVEGVTPLMAAAAGGCTSIVSKLIDYKADVNAQISQATPKGRTALDFAVSNNEITVASLLRRAGAKESQRPPNPKATSSPQPITQSATQPIKTTSRDSTLPDQRRAESQASGGTSNVSPCEAVKEYMDKYIAIWRQSGSSKSKCGGKTMDSPDLTERDIICLRQAAIEEHNRMMGRLQGTTSDELQQKSAELKRQYEPILKSKPSVWTYLQAWEKSVVLCLESKSDFECGRLGKFSQDILRLCETQ